MNRRDFLNYAKLSLPGLAIGSLANTSFAAGIFKIAIADGTCGRAKAVHSALSDLNRIKCDATVEGDLLSVTELELNHHHLANFHENDFAGLTNLKKLAFYSLFHKPYIHPEVKPFESYVFAPLNNLEVLEMDEELGELNDNVFDRLENLKVLRLESSHLLNLPQSLLELPKIEAIHATSFNFEHNADFDKLKSTYGDIVRD